MSTISYSPGGVSGKYSLTAKDYGAIVSTAQKLGVTPGELMAVISAETAGTMNPGIWGGADSKDKGTTGDYFGVFQAGESERALYNISTDVPDLAAQLDALVSYAIDRNFVPGEDTAQVLYGTILSGNAAKAKKGLDPASKMKLSKDSNILFRNWINDQLSQDTIKAFDAEINPYIVNPQLVAQADAITQEAVDHTDPMVADLAADTLASLALWGAIPGESVAAASQLGDPYAALSTPQFTAAKTTDPFAGLTPQIGAMLAAESPTTPTGDQAPNAGDVAAQVSQALTAAAYASQSPTSQLSTQYGKFSEAQLAPLLGAIIAKDTSAIMAEAGKLGIQPTDAGALVGAVKGQPVEVQKQAEAALKSMLQEGNVLDKMLASMLLSQLDKTTPTEGVLTATELPPSAFEIGQANKIADAAMNPTEAMGLLGSLLGYDPSQGAIPTGMDFGVAYAPEGAAASVPASGVTPSGMNFGAAYSAPASASVAPTVGGVLSAGQTGSAASSEGAANAMSGLGAALAAQAAPATPVGMNFGAAYSTPSATPDSTPTMVSATPASMVPATVAAPSETANALADASAQAAAIDTSGLTALPDFSGDIAPALVGDTVAEAVPDTIAKATELVPISVIPAKAVATPAKATPATVAGVPAAGPGATFGVTPGGTPYSVASTPGGGSSTVYGTSSGGTISFSSAPSQRAGQPSTVTGATSASGAPKVLCTYYMRKGWIERDVWRADIRYGLRCNKTIVRGYHWWAIPLVARLSTSPMLERLVFLIVRPWSLEMARREGIGTGSRFGKALVGFLEPIHFGLGKLRGWIEEATSERLRSK